MSSPPTDRIYEFDEFRVDARRRLLVSATDGKPVPLATRPFEVLLFLLAHAGEVVDKRAIQDAVWPNSVVEENSLAQAIHTLRRVLCEIPDDHRFIVTVPGRGYRFVAKVRIREAAVAGAANEPAIGVPRDSLRIPKRWLAIPVAFVAVITAGLGLRYLGSFPPDAALPATTSPAIAVLAFSDMSPTQDQAYLADGLAEEIIHLLTNSPGLRVIARTSSFSFRDKSEDIATIARQLNVTHVLEGSLRRSGDRIRVTAQLVAAETAEHVWSRTYDGEVQDVFTLQSDIASSIANALNVSFGDPGSSSHATRFDPRAHELYLQGLYLWNRDAPGDVTLARDYFGQAVQVDPAFVHAWSGLAGAYRDLAYAGEMDAEGAHAQQGIAVKRALELNPDLAEVQIRAGQYQWDSGNESAGERHIARAIALAPSDPLVLRVAAGIALDAGELEKAIDIQQRAVAVDPLNTRNRLALASSLTAANRWGEARTQLTKALELSPASLDLYADLALLLVLEKKLVEASALTNKIPAGPRQTLCLALVSHAAGRAGEADAALRRLIVESRTTASSGTTELYVAEVHAFRGLADEAFRWLENSRHRAGLGRGAEPSWSIRMQMRLSPFLQALHSDPRWKSMVDAPRAK